MKLATQNDVNAALVQRISELWEATKTTMEVITNLSDRINQLVEVVNQDRDEITIALLTLRQCLIDNGAIKSYDEWATLLSRTTHLFDQRSAAQRDES